MAFDHGKGRQVEAAEISCPSILAVIVLYRMAPSQASAVRSLLASAGEFADENFRIKILLYDNAPSGNPHPPFPSFVHYYSATCNGGLADAYNYALRVAQTEGYQWLLTLDQDSRVPESILDRLASLTKTLEKNDQVVAIVPHLLDATKPVSPSYVGLWRPMSVPKEFSGVPDREIAALNSATAWRVSYLLEIGGFDTRFWLDYLDHLLHRCAFRAGKRVYIAGDILVQHELSTLDLGGRMSSARFENLLQAESAFADLYRTPIERAMLILRWGRECCRYVQERNDTHFVRITLKAMLRRLFRSRRHRLAQWERSADLRRRSAQSGRQQGFNNLGSCQNSGPSAVGSLHP
jgi:GT2 family glycosyltransferase